MSLDFPALNSLALKSYNFLVVFNPGGFSMSLRGIHLSAFATITLIVAGCGKKEKYSETKNIFGADNRTPVTSLAYP